MPDQPAPTNSASEALAAAMSAAYGEGIVPPEALPTKEARDPNEPATAAAPVEAATGATAAAPVEAATGEEEKLSDEQLDAAAKKMTVAAGTAFKNVRNENKRLADEAAELRKKLEVAGKAPPATNEEIEKIRNENKEYKERLAAVDYQNSEEFASTIARPLQAVETAFDTLAKKYNVDAGALRAALGEPDANKRSDQLSELSTNFNRLDMQQFDRSILDYDRLNAEKRNILQTAFQRQEEQRRNAEAQRVQSAREIESNWKASLEASLNKLTKESPIFAKTDDEAWDKDMGERIAKVQAIDLGKVAPEAVARAFFQAEALDLALGLVTDLVKKNADQDALIGKLRGATPRAGGGTPPVAPVGSTGPTGGASFIAVARERLGSILPP